MGLFCITDDAALCPVEGTKLDELVKSPFCFLNDHLSQNAQSRSQMTFYETVKLELLFFERTKGG